MKFRDSIFIHAVSLLTVTTLLASCASVGHVKTVEERKFYKSRAVRRCLDFEKKGLDLESQACWAELLERLETEPDFKVREELSESDIQKVRAKVTESSERGDRLRKHWNSCLRIPSNERTKRLACFKEHLARYKSRMTRTERYEIENAITTTEESIRKAAGDVENTIEHAGKLLGADLSHEEEGIRIHTLNQGGLLMSAGVPEESIIILVDDTDMNALSRAERVSMLETCQDREIKLLVRHGGLDKVRFLRLSASCGNDGSVKIEKIVDLPAKLCTKEDAPELSLGMSWCYFPANAKLEVNEVCVNSPASRAGVKPGQVVVSINGKSLTGMSIEEIGSILSEFPENPIRLELEGGSLESPLPLQGPGLGKKRRNGCWRAMQGGE